MFHTLCAARADKPPAVMASSNLLSLFSRAALRRFMRALPAVIEPLTTTSNRKDGPRTNILYILYTWRMPYKN